MTSSWSADRFADHEFRETGRAPVCLAGPTQPVSIQGLEIRLGSRIRLARKEPNPYFQPKCTRYHRHWRTNGGDCGAFHQPLTDASLLA